MSAADLALYLLWTTDPAFLITWAFVCGFALQFALCWWVSYDLRCVVRGHHWGAAVPGEMIGGVRGECCYCCGARR